MDAGAGARPPAPLQPRQDPTRLPRDVFLLRQDTSRVCGLRASSFAAHRLEAEWPCAVPLVISARRVLPAGPSPGASVRTPDEGSGRLRGAVRTVRGQRRCGLGDSVKVFLGSLSSFGVHRCGGEGAAPDPVRPTRVSPLQPLPGPAAVPAPRLPVTHAIKPAARAGANLRASTAGKHLLKSNFFFTGIYSGNSHLSGAIVCSI